MWLNPLILELSYSSNMMSFQGVIPISALDRNLKATEAELLLVPFLRSDQLFELVCEKKSRNTLRTLPHKLLQSQT
ncbi:MAG: hypothetical protein ACE5R6_17310 [Candidatus Heimdallarchaeota archaeon]